jgi:hypothetical protein
MFISSELKTSAISIAEIAQPKLATGFFSPRFLGSHMRGTRKKKKFGSIF